MKKRLFAALVAGLMGAILFMAGCAAGTKYLNINYQVPSEVMGAKEPVVYLEVKDARFNTSLIGPQAAAQGVFADYSDMLVDMKIQKTGARFPDMELYNLSAVKLTEEAVQQRLAAMGIKVSSTPAQGQPNLIITIDTLMVDVQNGDLVAEAAFQADISKTDKKIISTRSKADSQRMKLIGAMGASKALDAAFTSGINGLDLSGLNQL